jgi:drug/metabolite transporter (DMT)-like permease
VTVSYVLAVLAAFSNAGSNVLQRKANSQEPQENSFSLRLVLGLFHRKTWWLGVVFVTASFLLQAGALSTGELASVQPIIMLELPLTLLGGRIALGSELHKQEWAAIALLTAGLAGLVGSLQPRGGSSHASPVAWTVGGTVSAAVITTLVIGGRQRLGEVRAGLFGCAAGASFGLTAAFMKDMTGTLSKGLVPVLTSWPAYAMAGAGLTGMFLVQNAFQAGKLVAAQPGISLLDPFTSIAWGVLAFHERTRDGALLILAGSAAAAMTVGAVLLSRSPVLRRSQAQARVPEP